MKISKASIGWIFQIVTGIAVVGLLGIHWVAQHYLVSDGLRNFTEVIDYLQNPLIFILEMVFLVVIVSHALLGVRAILIDLGISKYQLRAANISLSVFGICMVIYGVQLAWQIIH